MTVTRTAVNPWPWSVSFGYNQAEVVEDAGRVLVCAGQAAMSSEGEPQHAGDMAGQLTLALDNVEAVLQEAGMTLADVVRLNILTTDVAAFMANLGILDERLAAAGIRPPGTLAGVTGLFLPELMVEFEVTAVA